MFKLPYSIFLCVFLVTVSSLPTDREFMVQDEVLGGDEIIFESTTSSEFLETTTNDISASASNPIDFRLFDGRNPLANQSQETDETLPKPSLLSESTLAGQQVIAVEPLLFPNWGPLSWPSSIRDGVNTLARIPLMMISAGVGQYAEMFGLQMMSVGNSMLAMGAQGIGYTLKDYAIGFIAFGQTVKEWFVTDEVPRNTTSTSTDGLPSYGNLWSALGSRYYETRLEVEQLYGTTF